MANYIIGIGGTGAKCIESIIYLAAAGIFPKIEANFIFLDPDQSNGNLTRVKNLLEGSYYDCCKFDLGDTRLFGLKPAKISQKIEEERTDRAFISWSPMPADQGTISDLFSYNMMINERENERFLFDTLYTPAEISTNLNFGFRGHPSIGAAVLANISSLNLEPWPQICSQVVEEALHEEQVKVFLCGSIFGGTGAAGVPTIAKLLKKRIEADLDQKNPEMKRHVHFGAVPVLPYFSFAESKEGDEKNAPISAHSSEFLAITKSALDSYHFYQTQNPRFDVIYLIGFDKFSKMTISSPGGSTQKNDPHFIEILAALAYKDFLSLDPNNKTKGCFRIKREVENIINWEDFAGGSDLKRKLGQFQKFSFAFNSSYFPAIKYFEENENKSYQAPWFLKLVKPHKDALKNLDNLENFCKCFMQWARNIQSTSITDVMLELFNEEAYSLGEKRWEFKLELFDNLLREKKDISITNALHSLWTDMCNSRHKQTWGAGLGPFIRALYENCGLRVRSPEKSQDSIYIFYPKLKSDTQGISCPGQSGVWNLNSSWDELIKLSEGIDVGQIDIQINSTPDMWARPVIFERALLNEEHPLHKKIRGEWRGLLALIALQEIRGYEELQAKEINIETGSKRNNFLAALAELLPSNEWKNLTIYTWNRNAIGISSPSTIVCSSSDTINRCSSGRVRWFNGRNFTDPILHLSASEKIEMIEWLERARTNVQNDRLAGRINEFIQDLKTEKDKNGFKTN
jgi:hypothetical protein